ncbi:hypothetical protein AB4084_32570, partial [Lysobacter sp. 2RAB21]
ARTAMTAGLREQLRRMTARIPGADEDERRRQAIGQWSAMVGALILARLSDDPALSQEVLGQTRAWIAGMQAAGTAPGEAADSTAAG